MHDRTKAQLTIGLLAYFASVWILIQRERAFAVFIDAVILIIVLLIVMLVLAYIIIAILEWINIFDLKTNAILTLIVLTAFTINFTTYLISN